VIKALLLLFLLFPSLTLHATQGGIHALPVKGILAYGVEGAARGSGFGEFYNPCFFNRAIVSRNMR
jgi:hypothetical protein